MTRPSVEMIATAQERIVGTIMESLMSVSAFAIRRSLHRIFYVGYQEMEEVLRVLGYPKDVHAEFLHQMFLPFNADYIFPPGADHNRAAAWERLSAACSEMGETFEPKVSAYVDLLADMPLDYVTEL